MPDIPNTIDYLTALMNAIIEGRITAKDFRDMTPDQRSEYKAKLVSEEKDEIKKGKDRHGEAVIDEGNSEF